MLTATGLKRKELGSDGRKLFRHDGKQVLVIAHEGRLFAIANRCPHEGYPLSEGTLGPGCVLTCNWLVAQRHQVIPELTLPFLRGQTEHGANHWQTVSLPGPHDFHIEFGGPGLSL